MLSHVADEILGDYSLTDRGCMYPYGVPGVGVPGGHEESFEEVFSDLFLC
ncbi:MAG: hypothetical protein A4E58_01464 [Syntrophorhabdus sp. PtaB.Bin006]|nr:MAG: hypothetical protein A4E58_01464 [Syntrophorhabdus sp. PtaB.Bin006]